MAMPRSAAFLIPDHDDSVENEKDFAPPPPKKLKGEEDNSSVPISQIENPNDKGFSPLPKELKGEEGNSSDIKSQDSDTNPKILAVLVIQNPLNSLGLVQIQRRW